METDRRLFYNRDRMNFRAMLAAAAVAFVTLPAHSQPAIDYHQHLLSPWVAALGSLPGSFTARDLIPLLDAAGVQRALILSQAYQYGSPNRPSVPDEYAQVRRENDWTAKQVAEFPTRLRAFCGVDPLKPYAISEIERCAKDPYLYYGLKLHFGNSDVDLDNPGQVAQLRVVFRIADEQGMAIVVHLHPSVHHHRPYGAKEAEIFLNDVLPSAPHVFVQIAHLAGAGGFDDPADDSALPVFIAAIARRDPRMAHVYFDICGVAGLGDWEKKKQLIAHRIRQIGVARILWGSDGAFDGGVTPAQAIKSYRKLPLTKNEFHSIDTNLAPYMR
jgi:predicted TIM-barrel fold metal-dependent hydrolase